MLIDDTKKLLTNDFSVPIQSYSWRQTKWKRIRQKNQLLCIGHQGWKLLVSNRNQLWNHQHCKTKKERIVIRFNIIFLKFLLHKRLIELKFVDFLSYLPKVVKSTLLPLLKIYLINQQMVHVIDEKHRGTYVIVYWEILMSNQWIFQIQKLIVNLNRIIKIQC